MLRTRERAADLRRSLKHYAVTPLSTHKSTMKTYFNLCAVLLLSVLAGGAQTGKIETRQAHREKLDAELIKQAFSKRKAAILLEVKVGEGQFQGFLGTFISADGLALVDLGSLAREKKPEVIDADDTILKWGRILGVFPKHEMALMKFEHRPKEWLTISPVEPKLDERIALVPLRVQDPWGIKIPPVVGPVMAKYSGVTSNLRDTLFVRNLSLGTRLSQTQRTGLSPGIFALDQQGRLVAFMAGTEASGSQNLVHLAPVSSMAGVVAKMTREKNIIPFPLSAADNLIDTALLCEEYRKIDLASFRRNEAQFRTQIQALLALYPKSSALKRWSLSLMAIDPRLVEFGVEDFKPDPKSPKAEQVLQLEARAKLLLVKDKDHEGAIRELKRAIELSPEDFPETGLLLAEIYFSLGRMEDAERLFRKVYISSPERIRTAERLETILLRQGKSDESSKFMNKVYELEKAYRGR